ncbi:ATPase [Sorangium cellulosum]|uniref:histidine kinase n=1 Tax=Sorangium cellulosum TaxID=56 RepID=A0A2L0ET96_SORCE|nr:AAA family ATPase [Sorangium cellulosum]AUX42526.1 ATPase [Sorangium cellulosum]
MAPFDGEILEQIYDGVATRVHRGRRSDGQPVILKIAKDRSSHAALSALRHQHAILRDLEGALVVRALGLAEVDGHAALVQEDIGGASLKALGIAGNTSLMDWLALAVRLTEALSSVHARNVVHKDVNPSNIVLRTGDGEVRLIDFGISTLLPQEAVSFGPPARLNGTLLYMSPEQTGRINRPLDYRSDYYSLGATLYELLTGRAPFDAADPLELVHCHLARKPPSPVEIRPGVPQGISDVVLKLLAKNANDRYQSAAGLRRDLDACMAELQQTGTVLPFELGRDDRPEGFRLPEKLYGRSVEVQRLLAAFEGRRGAALLLVSGYSGVGKTALIQEVHRPLTLRRGSFVAGKFDQYQSSIPYSAVAEVLGALASEILTESTEALSQWIDRIREALQERISVLLDLVPSLSELMADPARALTVAPAEAQERLGRAVADFVSLFATVDHPLCIFFDDLQWADLGSLKLIEELLRSLRDQPLFVIGAFRDNEVGEGHPLRISLRAIASAGVAVEQIELLPLGREDVAAMVADALSVPPESAASLAGLLSEKTGGNPFFLRSFLRSLHTDGLITRDAQGFHWDSGRIAQRGVTDNVVVLLADRALKLPERTKQALLVAACTGTVFSLSLIALVMDLPAEAVGEALWEAVKDGLIIPLDSVHSRVAMVAESPSLRCRFAHDRVQQAVVSLVDAAALAGLQRRIGARLLATLDRESLEQRIFEVVGHFNAGRAAIEDAGERTTYARLDHRAARKALKAGASQQALDFARAGVELLGEDGWDEQPDLCRDLHEVGAEAAFFCSNLETLDDLSKRLLAHARDATDEVFVKRLEGQVHYSQQRHAEALRTYVEALRHLGIELSETPTADEIEEERRAAREALHGRGIEDLLDLPVCTDPAAVQAIQILNYLILITYSVMSPLYPVAICRLVRTSLRYGNLAESTFGYIYYGVLLSLDGDHESGYRYGQLALRLADRFGDSNFSSQVYLYAHYMLIFRKTMPSALSPAFLEAYRYGIAASSPFYTACSAVTLCITRFIGGHELSELSRDQERYRRVIQKFRQTLVLHWHEPYQQAVHNLREDVDDPTRLCGPFYDEAERLPALIAARDPSGLLNYYYCKAFLCFVFGDVAGALAAVESNAPQTPQLDTAIWASSWAFLAGLIAAAAARGAPSEQRGGLIELAIAQRDKLRSWAPLCPEAHEHKLVLVEAEILRAQGANEDLDARYERAASLAAASGMLNEQAIGCEVTARYHIESGHRKTARKYIKDAHHAYLHWGAVSKARAMEREHPQILPRILVGDLSAATLSAGGFSEQELDILDFVGVLEASQALSRETSVDRILTRLMDLVLSASGAEVGYLLREAGGEWHVDARASTSGTAVESASDGADLGAIVARSVVSYVARTRELLVLNDAGRSARFAREPRFADHKVRSVLCFPLLRKNETIGVIYLENNLVEDAFTPSRVGVLQILGAQAVISLENATLYGTLEQQVKSRTVELEKRNDELAVALKSLRETQDRMVVQERLASLGAMVAGIAHELRNPLNFVNNFAELSAKLLAQASAKPAPGDDAARMGKLLGTLELNLRKIRDHGQRMDGIIRSMLDHSRAGGGPPAAGRGERDGREVRGPRLPRPASPRPVRRDHVRAEAGSGGPDGERRAAGAEPGPAQPARQRMLRRAQEEGAPLRRRVHPRDPPRHGRGA